MYLMNAARIGTFVSLSFEFNIDAKRVGGRESNDLGDRNIEINIARNIAGSGGEGYQLSFCCEVHTPILLLTGPYKAMEGLR